MKKITPQNSNNDDITSPHVPNDRISIDIEGLLVWAFKHQNVLQYVERVDYHGHKVRTAVAMDKQLNQLKDLGVRVDCDGGFTDWEINPDALIVLDAVNCLARDERALVIEHALYGSQPIVPTLKFIPVTGGKNARPISTEGGEVDGVTRYQDWCDVKQEYIQRRVKHPVVRIAPKLSGVELKQLIQQRVDWCYALKKLAEYLVELNHHIIIKDALPLANISKIPPMAMAKLEVYNRSKNKIG